ncbi:MAG: transporter [Pyrinomonadaceae bacterium]
MSQNASPTPDDEPDFIVPARPTVSNPAQFQRPGVLQMEIGYDANFNARGSFRNQQDVPLALRFAISRRLLIELDTDSPFSIKDTRGITNSGTGDTQLGIQAVLQPETESCPGVAFAYYIKLPTAEASKGLGSGRVDHNFIGLVSKTVGKTTVDFNAIYRLAGKTDDGGHASSGQAALAVTQNLTKRFGVQGEISGASRNDGQPGAVFGLGVVTYQINRRTVIDSGIRFGLTPDAPRAGVVAGITFGIANLYKRHH